MSRMADPLDQEAEHEHNRCEQHGVCLDCEYCDPCGRDADRDAEIGALIDALPGQVGDAEKALYSALGTVRDLIRLYDVEMAEGSDGSDAAHELEAALRSLRHVSRIADWRKKLGA